MSSCPVAKALPETFTNEHREPDLVTFHEPHGNDTIRLFFLAVSVPQANSSGLLEGVEARTDNDKEEIQGSFASPRMTRFLATPYL
jgi:hypothetical protein